MSWAANRKLTIILIAVAFLAALIAVTLIATLHHTPSCTDNIQNQNEQGIDCGGPCPYLCSALEQAPTTLFTRAINQGTRTDVVALIQNKNVTAGAKNVPYQITLYGDTGGVVKKLGGMIDLPPAIGTGGKVAVYVPGALTTSQSVTNASLTIDPSLPKWYILNKDPRVLPNAGNFVLTNASTSPRLSATILNPSVTVLANVELVAIIYDRAGNVMQASQTIIPSIQPNDSQTAIFTWNTPFPSDPGSIEVWPVISLP